MTFFKRRLFGRKCLGKVKPGADKVDKQGENSYSKFTSFYRRDQILGSNDLPFTIS